MGQEGRVNAKAIVTHEFGKRTLEDVLIRQPKEGELLVDIVATGICHTDVVEVGSQYPCVQGSGYVRAIGSKVKVAKPGDAVCLSFASCGSCHFCKTTHPAFCQQFAPLNFVALGADDYVSANDTKMNINGSFFGQSSFSSVALAKESSVVNVSSLVKDREELKMMAPLGCGLQTGAGTLLRVAKATSEDSVAVLGLGGVGLAAIMAAKTTGCKKVVACDIVESRLSLSKELGATETVNPRSLPEGKLVEHIKGLMEHLGPTITIDTTGVLPLVREAQEFTRPMGRMVQVAAAPLDQMMEVHVVSHVLFNKQLMGAIEGDSIPQEAVPEMIQWWKDGQFPFDKFVKYYAAAEHEQAILDMKGGEAIKPVLIW